MEGTTRLQLDVLNMTLADLEENVRITRHISSTAQGTLINLQQELDAMANLANQSRDPNQFERSIQRLRGRLRVLAEQILQVGPPEPAPPPREASTYPPRVELDGKVSCGFSGCRATFKLKKLERFLKHVRKAHHAVFECRRCAPQRVRFQEVEDFKHHLVRSHIGERTIQVDDFVIKLGECLF